MLPSRTKGLARWAAGIFGEKSAKTLSWVSRVVRLARSAE
jgi:hypothetical protein